MKPLVLDETLNRSAQRKADVIVSENNYSHIDKHGDTVGEYVMAETSDCTYVSENINNNSLDVTLTVKSWMNSPAHANAITDPRYDYTGFGIKDGFTVQHFCDID